CSPICTSQAEEGSMTLSRRNAIKLGLGAGAGALPLLGYSPLLDEAEARAPRARASNVVKARPLPLSAVRLQAGPLKHAQEQDAHGDGYLSALKGGRRAFGELARGEIRSAAFDLNGEWSPWYTLHKTYAGLRDAYRHTGNRTALAVEIKFAAWAERILSGL